MAMICSVEEFISILAVWGCVVVGVVCSLLRWFHMCRPYAKSPEIFYPARKYMTFIFALCILLLPYVLFPKDPDSHILIEIFFPILLPISSAILLFSYFESAASRLEKKQIKWKPYTLLTGLFFLAVILFLGVLSLDSSLNLSETGRVIVKTLSRVAFVVGTTINIFAIRRVIGMVSQYNNNNYSSESDFPVDSARKVLLLFPLLETLLLAVPAFLENWGPVLVAVIYFLMSIMGLTLLICILHPHISPNYGESDSRTEAEEEEDISGKLNDFGNMPLETVDLIERMIVDLMIKEEFYRHEHLTMAEVAGRLGWSRSYVSIVFSKRLGGFFNYINKLRLDKAEEYLAEHPGTTIEEISEIVGFSSPQAYYTVRKKLRQ